MPRIQTTRTVKIALIVLRAYLIVMLLLILFSFVKTYWQRSSNRGDEIQELPSQRAASFAQ
jgi:hypothetical protein